MRVLVCGTNYGASYIRVLAGNPGPLQLAGILSTGSARSLALAQQARVAHYTDINGIPAGQIDLACVAVPGAAGQQLVLDLLTRGIHVICEHPIGAAFMQQALALARQQGRVFQVNAHFADLQAPQAFYRGLAVARQMGPALHYELAVNLRTLYSGLDLLGRAIGTLAGITPTLAFHDNNQPALFANVLLTGQGQGQARQGPVLHASLLCQNFASAHDDGSATLLNHRCSATFAHGNLLLAESNGPVLWFPSPVSMPTQQWRSYLPVDVSQLDGMQLQQQRDLANLALVNHFAGGAGNPNLLPEQQPDYLVALASLWQQILNLLQPPPA